MIPISPAGTLALCRIMFIDMYLHILVSNMLPDLLFAAGSEN